MKLSCEKLRLFVSGQSTLIIATIIIMKTAYMAISSYLLNYKSIYSVITEAVHRAATIAEAEGGDKIEATHLERILPQLLLDF